MVKKAKEWQPPPPLKEPPRDPEAAMIHLGTWWVFTVGGVPRLFQKQRVYWPNESDGRKRPIGYDWIDHGPVDAGHTDCDVISQIRDLVAEHKRGLT